MQPDEYVDTGECEFPGGGQMTWITRGLIVGTFVVGFSVGWLANNDELAVSAQVQASVMMKRIYTGEDGR